MTHQFFVFLESFGGVLGEAIGRVACVVEPELYFLGSRIVEFEEYRSSLAIIPSPDKICLGNLLWCLRLEPELLLRQSLGLRSLGLRLCYVVVKAGDHMKPKPEGLIGKKVP